MYIYVLLVPVKRNDGNNCELRIQHPVEYVEFCLHYI